MRVLLILSAMTLGHTVQACFPPFIKLPQLLLPRDPIVRVRISTGFAPELVRLWEDAGSLPPALDPSLFPNASPYQPGVLARFAECATPFDYLSGPNKTILLASNVFESSHQTHSTPTVPEFLRSNSMIAPTGVFAEHVDFFPLSDRLPPAEFLTPLGMGIAQPSSLGLRDFVSCIRFADNPPRQLLAEDYLQFQHKRNDASGSPRSTRQQLPRAQPARSERSGHAHVLDS